MADRRPLIEGLRPVTEVAPVLEEQFVYGPKAHPERGIRQPKMAPSSVSSSTVQATSPVEPKNQPLTMHGRVPLTTRVRQDIASALKRASLERQLAGVHPNTLQEILEAALEPWLRDNGYLS